MTKLYWLKALQPCKLELRPLKDYAGLPLVFTAPGTSFSRRCVTEETRFSPLVERYLQQQIIADETAVQRPVAPAPAPTIKEISPPPAVTKPVPPPVVPQELLTETVTISPAASDVPAQETSEVPEVVATPKEVEPETTSTRVPRSKRHR